MRGPLNVIATGLMLLALTATAQAAPPKANLLLDDWNALVNGGCDLQKHKVRTPLEASVLRNTPYAMAGYAFRSKGLRALFTADGTWYTPKSKAAPKFSPVVAPCIKKLKALEAKMKGEIGDTKAIKEKIFLDRSTYVDVRRHSQGMKGGPSTLQGYDSNRFGVVCATCKDLRFYEVICPKTEDCLVFVAGMGDRIPD